MSDLQYPRSFSSWVASLTRDQHAPQRKFIFDALLGITRTRTICPARWADSLRDEHAEGKAVNRGMNRLKMRFCRNLRSTRLDDDAVRRAYLGKVGQFLMKNDGEGTVIAFDGTDIQKPYALRAGTSGMEYLCGAHDGSEHEVGWGYPVTYINAELPDGNQFPLCLRPFSFREPGFRSQWAEERARIEEVAPYVGKKAIWAFDRGYDARGTPSDLDDLDIQFVIRLVASPTRSRFLHTPDRKHPRRVNVVAASVMPTHTIAVPYGKRQKKTRTVSLGAVEVRLGGGEAVKHAPTGPTRWVLVCRSHFKEPLVLLTSVPLTSPEAMERVHDAYQRRWKVEESLRAAKNTRLFGLGFEDARLMRLAAVQRLLLLVVLYYGYVAWLRHQDTAVITAARARAATGSDEQRDPRYRIVRGLGTISSGISPRTFARWRSSAATRA